MGKIWITSDWHFGHDRDFIWEPRGFKSVWEMNKEIISRYNEVVSSDDDIYVLGDLMLGNNEIGLNYIKELKGNLHVIRGNHDTDTRMDLYNNCYNIVEISEGQFMRYKNYHFYLSHYPCVTDNFDSHKPLETRMINLCGHTHTNNPLFHVLIGRALIYHCEVDAHNNYPVLLDDILQDLKEICC